ncbi:helix-turn-helix domain-containing protein [Clostridium formicaceticum]|uniref:Desulfoferrodoxin n=1 Tax=Clostridium formicaceticum TaxID=1497 RepID=A0AAC9RQJ8_9CLOT|nr:helix-turn-helix domain-containing protein [Clostridium formicaceticum]AOY77848.1 XRE family transcriptional regulator [Clostridium formicaceticum]ARE88460.1 Desulfoferrodoxin [Clostridium formicaceticum]
MDCSKIGALIISLRKEKNMTQKDIAEKLNISDKTISKWERGIGCPDVALLGDLSKILGVNIEKILLGDLEEKDTDGGNMKRIKFYVCKNCSNVITSTSEAEISCCGRKLVPLIAKPEDESHKVNVTDIENDYYIEMYHEMSKTHYISFVAFVSFDKVLLIKLYPEQNAELRIPKIQRGKLYTYCSQHGLWVKGV